MPHSMMGPRVVTSDKYTVQPWYKFLEESDFSHRGEVSFYYRRHEKIWEVVIKCQKDWDGSDTN
ncbi:hypothetical protein HKD37_15G043510 [Glycine soja]